MTPLGVLIAIAEGRRRHEWEMQSHLMAHIARHVGNGDARASDFDPYAPPAAEDDDVISMAEARAALKGK